MPSPTRPTVWGGASVRRLPHLATSRLLTTLVSHLFCSLYHHPPTLRYTSRPHPAGDLTLPDPHTLPTSLQFHIGSPPARHTNGHTGYTPVTRLERNCATSTEQKKIALQTSHSRYGDVWSTTSPSATYRPSLSGRGANTKPEVQAKVSRPTTSYCILAVYI